MEKSVIKSHLILGFILFLFLNFQNAYPQDKYDLGLEKYSIINSAFKHSRDQDIKIHKKTMPYETWMDEVWGDELYNSKGVGFCIFEDSELIEAFQKLKSEIKFLNTNTLKKNYLENKFQLYSRKNAQGIITLSDPIIIEDYSFLFRKSKKTKSLYVQKINKEGLWDYECGVTIYGKLH
jgi:hypothetical protein